MTAMDARRAYRLWAPTYAAETAFSSLDEELAMAIAPPLEGKLLLDAGCGTGRRLPARDATLAIGVDASFEMLAAANVQRLAAADVRALPFAAQSFDVVWCRLVLGHLSDPSLAYRELARVCRIGGHAFVSDFHADAAAAGHTRSFRDEAGTEHVVEHHVHGTAAHIEMAARVGLALVVQRDGLIGPSVKDFYVRAGRQTAYERDHGLAVVAAFLFRRTA
jgi:malonyl-CoA O-methyltransferase